ncbi:MULTISPECIES: hypothetical protein [Paenibacillus]|uniref:hypothetical protein n=1 Tax=Paenibacillus TaxID=44249 RepID=UPI001B22B471|nr:hypothetical protein [Paenibacillus macerans]GIP13989.1 hypothetical protein J1TS5_61590 [Paenibacillus macerans]
MVKIPKRVQEAIDAYKALQAKGAALKEAHQQRADELAAEIAKVQAGLAAASDAALEEPTSANIARETELQRRLAELSMDKRAAEDRKSRAFSGESRRLAELADAAIQAGREEAVSYHKEHYDARLKAVEDAKYAYLSALVGLHALEREAYDIYRTAADETNPVRAEQIGRPYFAELAVHWRGGARQVHGVSETEVNRALRHGKILHTSVAEGREIE